MQYQRLFCLTIFHDYYQDQICPDFTIEPTGACRKLLQGHRLLVKPMVNGLWVIVPVDSAKQPMIPLADSLTFTFLLRLNNLGLVNVTQLDADYDAIQSLYTFSNRDLTSPGTSPLSPSLVQRSDLKQATLAKDINPSGSDKVFGIVEIHNNDSLSTDPWQTSEFQIRFPVKQQVWKYYLIAAKNGPSSPFSIQDKAANISFSQVNIDPNDRVLTLIQNRFPTSQPVLFQSEEPVPCQAIGRQNIQLLKQGDNQPWIPHLPNPSNRHGTQVINLLEDL
ncbi:hypothetical protein [Leptothoe spongobia]|uniref:Uncharacterized protein n=1 Tax=Leptothoe spongobia TAU-MAC 1115 TaxID=1967444 RepID=A0A947GGQ6_9CYAN|nr:hypothetical protein [Leptothoe spongobia]MBT9314484.1 hypothetical protein [Leptothoe spongobia TAU-MAC 1115]